MLDFAIASLTVLRSRPLHAALVVALLCPGRVVAAPSSVDVAELRERAEALDAEGRFADAATAWETFADAAVGVDPRMLGYMHAFHAWMLALEDSGEEAHRAAARSILLRGLDDPQISARWRAEFEAALAKLGAEEVDAAPRVDLLDPAGEPRVAPAASTIRGPAPAPMSEPDTYRRSPHRIAGVVSLALAAPALGGLIYALARDAQITRQLETYGAKDKDSVTADDEAAVKRLGAEGYLVRDLAIGLGTTTAVLIGAGIGLFIVHARRRASARAITLLPDARLDLAGVALRGRF